VLQHLSWAVLERPSRPPARGSLHRVLATEPAECLADGDGGELRWMGSIGATEEDVTLMEAGSTFDNLEKEVDGWMMEQEPPALPAPPIQAARVLRTIVRCRHKLVTIEHLRP